MEYLKLQAEISRDFLDKMKVYRYKGKLIVDMKDREVMSVCHRWCEDNGFMAEFSAYRDSVEAKLEGEIAGA